jgi:hypothetical protein
LAKRCGPVNTGCFGDIKRSVPRAHERAYPTDHDDSRCRCRDTCPRLRACRSLTFWFDGSR